MNQHYASTRKSNIIPKRLLLILALIVGCLPAMGQSVIMNGNYFLTHNEEGTTVSTTATTTFNPATCLWNINNRYIRTADSDGNAFGGNNYLQASQNSVSLGGSSQWRQAEDNQTLISTRTGSWIGGYTYYYLRLNSTTWQIGTSNSNNGTAYAVDISSGTTTSTNPTISGSDVITATGNTTYTASGAAYQQGGYTDYYFNSAHHYFNGNTSITPANANITYSWSLTDNAYATVNSTSGVVTVASLPEYDITLTLTVTATATGGTPAAPANTTLTATKEITIQGTKPSAPIISVSGNTATITTDATGSTSIRYTLDGTNPTASTGTVYSGAIDLSDSTTSPVTIKAVTVRNGNVSEVTTKEVTLTLPTPTITVNATAGTATISSSVSGATIYYTLDGSTPSATNGTPYTSTISGLSTMQTIKAIAVKDGWNNSSVASATVTIPSGVSGGVVTLFDYEPHSWSYYSDATLPSELRSLNPADVKITYYGNGQTNNNMTSSSEDGPEPTSFSAKATGVQVGPNDPADTFIYYKTLERTDGSTAASASAATGNLKYTTIPNPFQVRPEGTSSSTGSSTEQVYVSGQSRGGASNNNYKIQVDYYDANNVQQTWSDNSNNAVSTTLTVKTGTTITLTAIGRSGNANNRVYSTVTAQYGSSSGGTIATVTANNSTYQNGATATGTVQSQVSDTKYRGFYAWRIKSLSQGLTIVGHQVGDTVHAESTIQFQTTSEYGNTVEFEALWAQAYVQTGTSDLSTYYASTVTSARERNFHVVDDSYTAASFQKTYPCTVIGHNPSSTTLNATRDVTGGFTGSADIKFEDVNISSATSSTWNANGHDLIVGRGCVGTVNYVRGFSGAINPFKYKIRLESGTYQYISFTSGYEDTGGNAQSTNITCTGTANYVEGVLGCDYDRAKGDNERLENTGTMIMGVAVTLSNQDVTKKTFDLTVKSGKFFTFLGDDMGAADASQSLYLSIANVSGLKGGERKLTIEGGVLSSVAGGIDAGNQTSDNGVRGVTIRMTGGTVNGAIYGGAAVSPASGDRKLVITGGTVKGWIGAGCNGVTAANTTTGGQTYGKSSVYIGGTVHVGGSDPINGSDGGTVFAAGKGSGASDELESGMMSYGTTIAIADECDILNNVYGGGNYGFAQTSTDMYIVGGTVHGSVFGGSNQNKGPYVNLTMTDGLVEGGLYGGSNSSGIVAGPVTMNINGGQVGTSSSPAGIYGGGLGTATRVTNTVNVNIGSIDNSNNTSGDAVIYGDVYGGSAKGVTNCNDNGTAATSNAVTNVKLNSGTINGSLYGGGHGIEGATANVWGPVTVVVNGGKVNFTEGNPSSVFGCNNVSGSPQNTVTVTVNKTDPTVLNGNNKTYAINGVYGGGNQAHYDYDNANYPTVTINNCASSIKEVYGGGNAAAVGSTHVTINGGDIDKVFGGGNGESGTPAHVGYKNKDEGSTSNPYSANGNVSVAINGGTINQVFGGSNAHGTIKGTIGVNATKSGSCALQVHALFGGGNKAASNRGNITIGCMGTEDMIDTVYCGANQADITGDINFTMTGGRIGTLFGGNNQSGTISGKIKVGVNWITGNNACSDNYLGNVFGGGNLAQYTGNDTVSILNGTVSGNVYGGGKGLESDHGKGQITGNPVVIIGDNVNGHTAVVTGDVYGGGDAGNVVGTPQVNVVNKCNTSITNVYGGGNAADVNGTDVNIDGGTITGMVFGGGHGDKNSTPQKEANVNGNVAVDVTGGTINKVFGGSNSKGNISGSVAVNIAKGTNSCQMHINEVYGGGNEAAGNAGTITIGCTGDYTNYGEGVGDVYGGANAADINNNIALTISGGHINNVYGGNNASGNISGTVAVTVNWDNTLTCDKYLGNVFGGGNQAPYSGTPTVTLTNGTVSHNVYGGGNKAGVGGSKVNINGGLVEEGVYGGCNSSGNAGPVVVSLTGGQVGTSSVHADVFGGGFGQNTTTSSDIKVTLNGTTVYGDLYGGSAFGGVNSNATEDTTLVTLKTATLYGSIFGGGKGKAVVGDSITATSNGKAIVNIDVYDPHLTGIYGGAYINGNVIGDITVNVNDTVGQDADHTLNVFGGGFGQATTTEGNVTVNFGTEDGSKKPLIYGNLYGGSSQGQVNATGKTTTVYVYNGTVNGDVYGGGLGVKNASGNYNQGNYVVANDSIHAVVNGDALVYIGTAAQTSGNDVVITGNIFGGSDRCGNTLGDITVHIFHTAHTTANTAPDQSVPDVATINDLTEPAASAFALKGVYGGGNLAHYESTGANSTKKASVYVHGCYNSIQYLYGGGNAANTTANYIEIEGGRFYKIFGGGNGEVDSLPGANVTNGDATTIVNGGVFNYIFGGSNTKGDIAGNMNLDIEPIGNSNTGCGRMIVGNLFGGGNVAPCNGGELTVKCGDLVVGDVYGGANMADVYGDVVLNIEGGNLNNVFGGSRGVAATNGNSGVAANILGSVTLNLKGGTMKAAFGGSDQNGNITGQITVNVIDAENNTCPLVVDTIYGAGNVTPYTPDSINDVKIVSPIVNLQHMKRGNAVTYDVFGGGLGSTAKVTANPMVIIGNTVDTAYAKVGRNVYGGGSKAPVDGGTKVVVRGYAPANDTIMGSVFGGGSQAGVSDTTVVQILNGTVLTGVYGGCNTSGTVDGNVTVDVTGGVIGADGHPANVHGGGYGNLTETKGHVDLTINGGSVIIWGDVYGGSAKGDVNDDSSDHTNVTLTAGTIHGNLYGGGLGEKNGVNGGTNDYAALVNGAVQVTVNGGTVNGAVYGCNNVYGAPQSTVNVDIYGTDTPASGYALGNVFGGGNQAAYPNTPVVKVHNCDNSIEYVYGGGNAATVAATDVTIYGGHTINNVFGGCYGADVTTSGTNVKIYGGTINHVYGGNNLSGNITGSINVTVEKTQESGHPSCEMHIGEVYGGGNKADSNAGNITINCTGNGATEGIEYVYGGANQADVTGPIVLNITEGRIANVFGGNNTSGTITDSITVNINKKASPCVWDITNVYGGGNQAVYGTAGDNLPIVNILNGLVSGDVFGGGLGLEGDPTKGVVTGNPQVIVDGAGAEVSGGVYGGGSLAPTKGNPVVTLTTGALTKVFGGGKAANINGAPTVNINGGTVSTGVYGGCDSIGEVSGNITVNVNNGTIGASNARANIHGGGYGQNTSTKANVTVNFGVTGTDHNEYPKLYGDVYGGSALGEVNANSANNTTVNILNGVLYTDQTTSSNGFPVYNGGNVFGGGLGRKAGGGNTAAEAKVNGIVIVNIGGPNGSKALNPDDDDNVGYAIIGGNVYGCNNTNGSPQDSVTVNVYRTHRTGEQQINYTGENPSYAIANVFGGGNEADYVPSDTATHKKLKVYIHDCYNSVKRVFGGSNAAAAGAANTNSVTVHTIIEGGRFDNVFGGGNGEVQAANINGNVNLEIHGGIVNEFFVGSNQSGTISGTSKVTVDETSNCESVLITEFFCGGKYADVEGNIEASIDCSEALTVHSLYGGCKEADVHGNVHLSVYGGYYTNVFGGSKGVLPPDNPTQAQLDAASADITGSVTLDLYGGTMENVFGGSNVNGNINGTITVNVIDAESQTCPLYITNIYGGSNLTSYTPSSASITSPVVNVVHIKSGISGNVYGASKGVVGTAATVTANPQVNIGYDATQMTSLATYLNTVNYSVPAAPRAIISGSVFGGGDAATVIGNTEIFLRKKAKVFGNVYGGGNMGEVTGNTKVIVNGQNN